MKISKKILAIVLSVIMLISVMPFAAFAVTQKVSVGTYEELANAVAAYNADDGNNYFSVTLTADIELQDTLTIDSNSTSYFAISGKKTISIADGMGSAFYVKHGRLSMSNVTITGAPVNYKLIYLTGSTASDAAASYSYVSIGSGANINCTNGYAVMVSAIEKHAYGVNISVSGGNIYGFYGALYVNGSIQDTEGTVPVISVSSTATLNCNEDINVEDGSSALYAAGYAKYKISGGTFNGASAVYAKAGELTISGGTFNGNGDARAYIEDHNGSKPTGEALVLENNSGYAPLHVSITGGTFNSVNAEPVGAYANPSAGVAPAGFVTSGIFKKNGVEVELPAAYLADGASYFTIPDGSGEKVIISADTIAVYKSGTWKAVNDASQGVTYAAACAAADTTVYALKDSLAETYNLLKNRTGTVTIDLQGHNVINTSGSETATTVKATMTLGSNKASGCSLVIKSSKAATFTAAYGVSVAYPSCSLTVDKNVTLKSTNATYTAFIDKTANNASITVNGKIENAMADGTALYVNGACGANNVINMNGTLTADGAGIYAAGNATYNIAGSITAGTGIYQKGGNLAITKGTITANGAKAAYAANGSGFAPTGDALAIEKASGYTLGTVAISGGTLKAANGKAVAIYPADATVNVAITGGTFTAAGEKDDISAYFDTAVYLQDDFGKIIVKDGLKVAYTNAAGKTTYTTSLSGPLKTGTYKLLADVSFTSVNVGSSMYENQDVTLDLNGHNITAGFRKGFGSIYSAGSGSDLEIINTGAQAASINCAAPTDNHANINVTDAALVIGKDVVINGSVAYFGDASVDVYGSVINTAEGEFAISSNNAQASGTTLRVYKGAVVSAPNGTAIYHPEAGLVEITGGTISGATAFYAKRGEIYIFSGSFNGTGAAAAYPASGNGTEATGDAVVFDNMQGYAGTLSVEITGGDFNSANGKAVASYATGLDPITGFLGATAATFSSDVTELCATGYKADLEGTKYIVVEIDVAGATNGAELEVAGDIEINTYFDADVYVQEFNLNPATAELRVTYNAKSDIDRNPEYVTDVYNLATEAEQVDESEVSDAAFAQTYKNSNIIAPAQITEEVVVGLYASSEATIPVKEVRYSVYKMMRNIIENAASYSPELVAYAQATIDYGKAAQSYFGYRADDLASIAYSEAAIAAPSVAALDSTFGRPAAFLPYDLQATGVSLTIKSQVEVNVTTAANFVIGEVSDGAAADFAEVNGKRCLVITDITAANTLKSINVGVNGDTLIISALNICRSIIGGNNSANYKSLAMALAFYGQAAEAYYATQA